MSFDPHKIEESRLNGARSMDLSLQPDQLIAAWAPFVASYESIFEPLTDSFARAAFDHMGEFAGARVLDVGCGPGGAALIAALRGAVVTAIDASPPMVERTRNRAHAAGVMGLQARTMDAEHLDLAAASIDVAYSGFGIVLLPDPVVALREMARVLVPGGFAAIVTWTEPQHYELADRLRQAIQEVDGSAPVSAGLPAQLRFTEPKTLVSLLATAGFIDTIIHRFEGDLVASTPAELRAEIAFAPGMAAMLDVLGDARELVLDCFQARLENDFDTRPVALRAVAHAALARTRIEQP